MPPPEIRILLRRVGWILARRRAWRWGSVALLGAAGASLLVTLTKAAIPVELPSLTVLGAGVLLALLLAVARALVPIRDVPLLVRTADHSLALQDRLATALDLTTGRIAPTALAASVMADAASVARRAMALDLRQALPARPPRAAWRAVGACALALAAGAVLPGLTVPGTPARDTSERIRREGQRLEQVGRRLERQARTARAPEARRAAPQVQTLGRQLQAQRLERSEALSRMARLARQLEETRRRLEARAGLEPPRPGTSTPEALARQSRALARQIQQLREVAARLAQEQLVGDRRELAQRLGDLSEAGEGQGGLPEGARREIEEARRRVAQGNLSAAERHLNDALFEMEGMQALLADQEALARVQQEVEASAGRIAGGGEAAPAPPRDQQAGQSRSGEGTRRVEEGAAPTEAALAEGPNEGSQPGQGRPDGKLGEETARLAGAKERTRVRGREGAEGEVNLSELLGAGRRTPARAPTVDVPPLVVRRVDEAMVRLRVPPELRAVVRQYFQKLAGR